MTWEGKEGEPSEAHFASNSPTREDLLAPNPASHLSPKQESVSPSEPSSLKYVYFKMDSRVLCDHVTPCSLSAAHLYKIPFEHRTLPFQMSMCFQGLLQITMALASLTDARTL